MSRRYRSLTNNRLASRKTEACPDASRQNNQLHQELIALFEKELVLEIILVLGQDIEARENAQYNLLMMELLDNLLKTQDPAAVASARMISKDLPNKQVSILTAKLKQEQSHRLALAGTRHGHFGGMWMKQTSDGYSAFVSTSKKLTSSQKSSSKRKNRKAEPFIGSGKSLLVHCRMASMENGTATRRANIALNKFCKRFIKDCYGPLMKSLKNEFRRDSHRLESGDKVVFFRIVWFFCQWWRLARPDKSLGQLIFTMDVFTFNLVLSSTDADHQRKHHSRLAQSVALYSEMMYLLIEMHGSKDETESMMARGLLDRLFYGSEPLDRLPKLLNRWAPGMSTREYLCDLVELCHTSVKLLEMNHHESQAVLAIGLKEKSDKVQKMRASAAQFDVHGYFIRRVVSHQFISMLSHLLGQYKINSNNVNHRVLSMFLRIMRTEIIAPESQETGVAINPIAIQKVTLEPLIFNTQLLVTVQKILGDSAIVADEKENRELILFCTNYFNRFLLMASKNPMLFIECLFRNPTPSKFCELVSNHYIGEELRMLAEREILLEEQHRLNEDEDCDTADPVSDEDDDENEFDQFIDVSQECCKGLSSSLSDNVAKVKDNFCDSVVRPMNDDATLSGKTVDTQQVDSMQGESTKTLQEGSGKNDLTSTPILTYECQDETMQSRSSASSPIRGSSRDSPSSSAKRDSKSVVGEDQTFSKRTRFENISIL